MRGLGIRRPFSIARNELAKSDVGFDAAVVGWKVKFLVRAVNVVVWQAEAQ